MGKAAAERLFHATYFDVCESYLLDIPEKVSDFCIIIYPILPVSIAVSP